MKRVLFLFTLLLCLNVTQTIAQGYHKFLNNSSWCQSANPGFGQPIDYYVYNQRNDTIINSLTYAKIIIGTLGRPFFIREDTIAKKIFIKDSVNAPEVILYDFSLNVGDTLYAKHGWCAGKKLIVTTIDTVTTLVGPRRHFILSDTGVASNYNYGTIESIGSIQDPFLNYIPAGDPVFWLVCSYQNHIKTYDANLYGYTCYYYDSIPCLATYTYTFEPNGQVNFTNVIPAYSYTWSAGVAGYSVTNTPSVTITFPCNGTYSVQCFASMNSSGNDVCFTSVQNFTITNIPGSINANYTYTLECGGQIDFTNITTGLIASTNTYSGWNIYDTNGYLITYSDSTSPSFTLTPNQSYSFQLYASDYYGNYECSSSHIETIFVSDCTTDIYQIFDKNQIEIYPNPASNKITIDAKEITEIKLCNLLGKEVISTKEKEIDVSNLPDGVYFIQVQMKQSIYTQKIIVQH